MQNAHLTSGFLVAFADLVSQLLEPRMDLFELRLDLFELRIDLCELRIDPSFHRRQLVG